MLNAIRSRMRVVIRIENTRSNRHDEMLTFREKRFIRETQTSDFRHSCYTLMYTIMLQSNCIAPFVDDLYIHIDVCARLNFSVVV